MQKLAGRMAVVASSPLVVGGTLAGNARHRKGFATAPAGVDPNQELIVEYLEEENKGKKYRKTT